MYHLAVNLMDRYLSFESIKSEKDFYATSAACAMISLKIRRATEECLSYEHLRYHFCSVSESRIRVSDRGRKRGREEGRREGSGEEVGGGEGGRGEEGNEK